MDEDLTREKKKIRWRSGRGKDRKMKEKKVVTIEKI